MNKFMMVMIAWLLTLMSTDLLARAAKPAPSGASGNATTSSQHTDGRPGCFPWSVPPTPQHGGWAKPQTPFYWLRPGPHDCSARPDGGGGPQTAAPVPNPPGGNTNPSGVSGDTTPPSDPAKPVSWATTSSAGAANQQQPAAVIPAALPNVSGNASVPVVSPDGTTSLAVGYRFIPVHEVSLCANGTLSEMCDAAYTPARGQR